LREEDGRPIVDPNGKGHDEHYGANKHYASAGNDDIEQPLPRNACLVFQQIS
jgi:hypothetical protein